MAIQEHGHVLNVRAQAVSGGVRVSLTDDDGLTHYFNLNTLDAVRLATQLGQAAVDVGANGVRVIKDIVQSIPDRYRG